VGDPLPLGAAGCPPGLLALSLLPLNLLADRTTAVRGRLAPRLRYPFFSSADSWCETLDVLASPAASPISRSVGA
jgi:hypothetical protein